MSEWKEYKLGELTSVITKGTTPSTLGGGFVERGVNFIKSEAVSYNAKIDKSTFVFIDEETQHKLKRSQLKKDDILFSMAGIYLGKNGLVTEDMLPANTNQALAIIRLDQNKALPKFIHYYLRQKSVIEFVNNMSGQSAQPNINFEEIKAIDILLPPLPEQTAIASILSSLDDKIDLLQRQNKTLEQLAETLFRQWFVEEMVESWEIKTISQIIDVRDGTHDSPKQQETGFHLITSKHLKPSGIDFSSAYKISEEDFNEINKRSIIEKNDILFSMIGTLGLIHYVESEPDFAIKNIGLFKTSQKPEFAYFLYLLLKSPLGEKFIYESADGSTQEYITLGSLRNFKFRYPGETKIIEFQKFISPSFMKIFSNNYQIRTLTQLRDTLLPKLMSGEVRVKMSEL